MAEKTLPKLINVGMHLSTSNVWSWKEMYVFLIFSDWLWHFGWKLEVR